MGGNAIKKYIPAEKIVRLDRQHYKRLTRWIEAHPFFSANSAPFQIQPTIYSANKVSFGDLDILIKDPGENMWDTFLKKCTAVLGAECMVRNGNVISLGIDLDWVFGNRYLDVWKDKYFQVDFIKISESKFQNAVFYTSFGDVGHIIGMLFNRCGFKYGSDGLSYLAKLETPWGPSEATFKITTSLEDVLCFLNLDEGTDDDFFSEWLHTQMYGESMGEVHVWDWIRRLPLFKEFDGVFRNKTPDESRPVFARFIEYLKDQNEPMVHPTREDVNTRLFSLACKFRPTLKEDIARAQQTAIDNAYIKTIFNGEMVRDITKLDGKVLGDAIADFKSTKGDWTSWAKNQTADGMRYAFIMWYRNRWYEGRVQ